MTPVPPGSMEVLGRPDSSPAACPACGQEGALIALGVRYDHPQRWQPWVTRMTHLALCACCDALVATKQPRPSCPQSGPRPLLHVTGRPATCGMYDAVQGELRV